MSKEQRSEQRGASTCIIIKPSELGETLMTSMMSPLMNSPTLPVSRFGED